jgi:hypothetical protein
MYELPKKLNVNGRWYRIRTDFRAVLDILAAFSDPELDQDDKDQVMREILYIDYETIPVDDWEEAAKQAAWFVDGGIMVEDGSPKPRTMDWQKDSPIIIPAVNRIASRDVRSMKYLHWWTFFGYYMEIGGDCLFSTVQTYRQNRAEGKKPEKWEIDFYRKNKSLCELPQILTREQKERKEAEEAALKKMLGE